MPRGGRALAGVGEPGLPFSGRPAAAARGGAGRRMRGTRGRGPRAPGLVRGIPGPRGPPPARPRSERPGPRRRRVRKLSRGREGAAGGGLGAPFAPPGLLGGVSPAGGVPGTPGSPRLGSGRRGQTDRWQLRSVGREKLAGGAALGTAALCARARSAPRPSPGQRRPLLPGPALRVPRAASAPRSVRVPAARAGGAQGGVRRAPEAGPARTRAPDPRRPAGRLRARALLS